MTLNFFLNNAATYRHRRLRGARLLLGLISFYAVSSIVALVTIREATLAPSNGTPEQMLSPKTAPRLKPA